MKPLLFISLALTVVVSSAHKFTVTKVKRHELSKRASNFQTTVNAATNTKNGLDISSVHDLIYLTNITLGGLNYSVQLDTGSSDLFIKGDTYPISNTNETSLTHNLTYAIGWAYGHIAYAPVQFLDMHVASQAFLDASTVSNPAMAYGAQGIIGLGFTRLSSIDRIINNTHQSTGRSLLHNLFLVNPEKPNFIAVALQRTTDKDDNVQGSFSIGEYDPQFANVSNNEAIPTWPVDFPFRWNLLIDAVIVNNAIMVPASSVPGAPSNKAVALIDSGASYSYVSKELCDAIYSKIPGATYNASVGFWLVPCDAEVDMAMQIGGQVFPVHPLDVTPSSLVDPSLCLGSFVPQSVAVGSDIDWLIGDNFLRSVYSVYDFGDFDTSNRMGSPYMKFLSLIDPNQASAEFHQIRGGTPKTNITYTGLSGAAIAASSNISDDTSRALEMIVKFIPAILAVVALNTLVLVIVCIVWLVSFCRKRKIRATARIPRSRSMRTMPQNDASSYIAGVPNPYQSNQPHVYEPVSMALTEDTFVPPSPAFHNFEGSKLRAGDRPKSFSG